jgi:hypothetical protein
MNQKQFLEKVKPELERARIKVLINSKGEFNGSFDSVERELTVNTNGQLVFQTLIHEYCHFLQWKNERQKWNFLTKGVDVFFEWIDGKDFTEEKTSKALVQTIELELDCERKSLELIRNWHLDVNPFLYTTAANAYLFSYIFSYKYRQFVMGIYKPEILRYMPGHLLDLEDYLDENNIPKNVIDVFENLFE